MTQHHASTVRAATAADREDVLRVAVSSGLFPEQDVAGFAEVVDADLGDAASPSRWLVAADQDGTVVGAAYAAPEPFGDRVWNLLFLAVDRGHQTGGVGTALVDGLVADLRSAGPDAARVLLVETSTAPAQDAARAFYPARGLAEVARIPQYYGPDEDKVVFWGLLAP